LSWIHPFRTARRNRATSKSFPAPWDRIVAGNVPLDARLPASDRIELRRRMQIFLAEKRFEGVGGLEMADEIRVTVAAQACLLLLHRDDDDYPALSTILVYPTAYRVPIREHSADGMVTEGHQVPARRGVERGDDRPLVGRPCDAGRPGMTTGTTSSSTNSPTSSTWRTETQMVRRCWPITPCMPHGHGCWATSTSSSKARSNVGSARCLDAYGTQSPAEFFAVATETFFEKPVKLRDEHSELYGQLRDFYRQDPAVW